MKTNLFSSFTKQIRASLKLVNSQPVIIFLAVFVSLLSLLGQSLGLPLLSLLISAVLFAWSFVEVDLLNQAKLDKKIKLNKTLNLLIKYLRKSWPLIAFGLVAFFVIVPLLLTAYLAPKLGQSDSAESRQEILINELDQFQTFIKNTIGLDLFIIIFDGITTFISLWFVQLMVLIVIKDEKLLSNLKQSFAVVKANFAFFLNFTIILSLVGIISRYLLQLGQFGLVSNLAYLVFTAYLGLIIKATVLRRFLE